MQLIMSKAKKTVDKASIRNCLVKENEYILDLLNIFDVPDTKDDSEMDSMYLIDSKKSNNALNPTITDFKKSNRAQTAEELQERLNIIKNKMKTKKRKISERGVKKREAKKMKKNKEVKKILISAQKAMKNERSKGNTETIKVENGGENGDDKSNIPLVASKPVFNEEGKIVFSKFDFASHPGAKVKKSKNQKTVNNPRELLKKIKETDKKLNELKEDGNVEKVKELKQEMAWQKAFEKTEGKKVKDDPKLLYKAIKRKKVIKKKSKQKWAERKEKVEKTISQRQKKREENINKKITEKKNYKLKKLSKKGRIIPGF